MFFQDLQKNILLYDTDTANVVLTEQEKKLWRKTIFLLFNLLWKTCRQNYKIEAVKISESMINSFGLRLDRDFPNLEIPDRI
jgi:hypothetical protein